MIRWVWRSDIVRAYDVALTRRAEVLYELVLASSPSAVSLAQEQEQAASVDLVQFV